MSSTSTRTDFLRSRLAPGTRLNGIYEIDRPIGLGGMGEIYKGHLIETGDPVAIKMMLPEFSEQEAAFTLFRKEASALHHIQHDAIVRYYVFTVEPELRRPYLAMEFVEGRTLTEIVHSDGPLSLEAVGRLLYRLASGLQAAHSHGIVHRDISPDNIIIPNNDVARAKIIDFGIARTTQHGTVIAGGFAGKFSYVSPEQLGLFGGEVTARSDIYSLGLVVAEALTGKPLDMGGSQVEIVEKRRRVPNLGAIHLIYRPLLERMLQPDPNQRPDSMAMVAASAARLVPGESQTELPDGRKVNGVQDRLRSREASRSRGRHAAIGAALIALIGGSGGAIYHYAMRTPALVGMNGPAPSLTPPTLSPQSEPKSDLGQTMPSAPSRIPSTPQSPGLGTNADLGKSGGLAPPSIPTTTVPKSLPLNPVHDPAERVRTYIERYDGGDCFFVSPITVTARAAEIEGLGSSEKPFDTFNSAFLREIGFEPDIALREVTKQQCRAVSFLSRLRAGNARAPRLDIDRDALHSGEVLSGLIDHYGDRQVALILVSDGGAVQNVSDLLKPGTDAKAFSIGMKRVEGSPGRQPQLLIAVASPSMLTSLKGSEAADTGEFFERVLGEAQKAGIQLSAAARYFVLEK